MALRHFGLISTIIVRERGRTREGIEDEAADHCSPSEGAAFSVHR